MLAVIGGITWYGCGLLDSAADGRAVTVSTLFVPFAALLVAGSMVVLVFQSVHVANRVAGPEHRLAQAMRRIRDGDLTFRISLRRGDLLGPLARECNELLDWLNDNPPAGAAVGSDVVSLDGREADFEAEDLE